MKIRYAFWIIFLLTAVGMNSLLFGSSVTLNRTPEREGSGISRPDVSPEDLQPRSDEKPTILKSPETKTPDRVKDAVKRLPDLSFTKISIAPLSSGKDNVEIEVKVKNDGDVDVRSARLLFQAANLKKTKSIPLRAGAEQAVKMTFAINTERFSVEVSVDPHNKIAELDEQNNSIKTRASIGHAVIKNENKPPPPAAVFGRGQGINRDLLKKTEKRKNAAFADLSVEEIRLTRTAYKPGMAFSVLVRVKNEGEEADGKVSLFLDRAKIGSQALNIGLGASKTFVFKGKVGNAGKYLLRAVAETSNKRTDRTRNNNSRELTLTVSEPSRTLKSKVQSGAGEDTVGKISNADTGRLAARKDPDVKEMLPDNKRSPDNLEKAQPAPKISKKSTPLTTVQSLAFISPRAGESWQSGKTYEIRWYMPGRNPVLRKVVLANAGKTFTRELPKAGLFSDPIQDGVMGLSVTVPAGLKTDQYTISVDALVEINDQIIAVNQSSSLFRIYSPAVKTMLTDNKSIPPGNKLQSLADVPSITFFDYSERIYGSSGQLKINFFWKDGDANLEGGYWTLEQKINNSWHKKTFKFSSYHPMVSTQFVGTEGLAQIKIPFPEGNTAVPIRFSITDASGATSNVMAGVVNEHKGGIAQEQPPAALEDRIEFISPAIKDSMGNTVPDKYVKKGSTLNIELTAQVIGGPKLIPVTLYAMAAESAVKIATIKVPNDGSAFQYKWKAAAPTYSSSIRLAAVSPEIPGKTYYGALIEITPYKLVLTAPVAGQHLVVGQKVGFSWTSPKEADPKDKVHIYYAAKGGGYSQTKQSVIPVPVTNNSWNWTVNAGKVAPGPGFIHLRSETAGTVLASVPVVIDFPPSQEVLSVTFNEPAAGSISHWVEDELKYVKWTQRGSSTWSPNIQLQMCDAASLKIIDKIGPIPKGQFKGETPVRLRRSTSPDINVYRICAVGEDLNLVVGKSGLISLTEKNTAQQMLPSADATFEVGHVIFPSASSNFSLDIKAYSSKPFMLDRQNLQEIEVKVTNYQPSGKGSVVAAHKLISLQKHSNLFPTGLLPKGKSGYNLTFKLDYYRDLEEATTIINMPSDFLGAGKVCHTIHYPKLEITITTKVAGGKTVKSSYKSYLDKIKGLVKNHYNLPGEVKGCNGADLSW